MSIQLFDLDIFGGFLKYGGTPNHPLIHRLFNYKPSSYKGVALFMESPLWIWRSIGFAEIAELATRSCSALEIVFHQEQLNM